MKLVRELVPLGVGGRQGIEQRIRSKEFVDRLLALDKCPDLIVNRGHYFGSNLEDADKRALIALLKTF